MEQGSSTLHAAKHTMPCGPFTMTIPCHLNHAPLHQRPVTLSPCTMLFQQYTCDQAQTQRSMVHESWCKQGVVHRVCCMWPAMRDTLPFHFTASEIKGIRCPCFKRHVSDFIDTSLCLCFQTFENC